MGCADGKAGVPKCRALVKAWDKMSRGASSWRSPGNCALDVFSMGKARNRSQFFAQGSDADILMRVGAALGVVWTFAKQVEGSIR
jgi:hypothetical protein